MLPIQTITMAYYKHENYFSEGDMKGWSEERKAGQRELNRDLRLAHYAVNDRRQFRKLVADWAETFDFEWCDNSSADVCANGRIMKMMYMLKLSRENGILSDTIRDFARVECELLEKCELFVSPAGVAFNTAKYEEHSRAAYAKWLARKVRKN